MTDDGFPLPLSSYEELEKIIRAYGHLTGPKPPAEVGKVAVVHETIVSRNNAFLVAIGVLTRGRQKELTDTGRALARALDYTMEDDIQRAWRCIVQDNEFFQKVLAAVRIRKGMDEAAFASHVAYTAGQPNKSAFLTGARAIISILKAAGLLVQQDDRLLAVLDAYLPAVTNLIESTCGQSNDIHVTESELESVDPSGSVTLPPVSVPNTGVAVALQIQVQCKVDDLPGLGAKIRQLLKDLSTSSDLVPNDTQGI